MPLRRRPPPISSAAALPASRLPLGTPQLATPKARSTVSPSTRPPSNSRSYTTDPASDKENHSVSPPLRTLNALEEPSMSSNTAQDAAPARSLAAAKLERQNKRNEVADPTVIHPAPLDKRAQQARGKKQKWQAFDYTAQPNRPTTPSDGGVPVSEVRVNRFHAPSQGSSHSRPVSVMSQRTNETGPSDIDRPDPSLTSEGFQIFQRRKNKRNGGDLNAYEDKPEERQTTVEATSDESEIFNVFGNALPKLGYIEENPGTDNGEIKFIQHPNGDVSAQQWSAERFTWDNIGQFSNIRKKLEGQLAADRLKGETGYQASQKNTLAYFRIIAKQREATVMGHPFGTKDINAAIPEPQREPSVAPTAAPKESIAKTGVREESQTAGPPNPPIWNPNDYRSTPNPEPTPVPVQQQSLPPQQHPPTTQRGNLYQLGTNFGQNSSRQDDPFYSIGTYQHIYGSQPTYTQPFYGQSVAPAQRTQPTPKPQGHGLNYGFHFPQANTVDHAMGTASPFQEVEGVVKTGKKPWEQSFASQTDAAPAQKRPQYHTTGTLVSSNDSDSTITAVATRPAAEPARPKPVTPLENRTALRDQLWRQAEAAKERSLSQGNILSRTVLYDPLQDQSPKNKIEPQEDPIKHDVSPTLNRNSSRKTLQPPSTTAPTSSWLRATMAPPKPTKSTSPEGTVIQNLHDSSPDRYPVAAPQYLYQPPALNSSADTELTPQVFTGPFFTADKSDKPTLIHQDQKAYDEELQDWWNSGKRFARQEEFYRSITATSNKTSKTSNSNNNQPHLTPIGPPSSQRTQEPSTSSYSDPATRLLIPVLENLSAYVQGPAEKRRDYWCQWTSPPEWSIDRSESGNNSFYDEAWGTPPARVGRDPRYAKSPWVDDRATPMRGRGGVGVVSPYASFGGGYGGGYVDRRFGYAGGGGYWG